LMNHAVAIKHSHKWRGSSILAIETTNTAIAPIYYALFFRTTDEQTSCPLCLPHRPRSFPPGDCSRSLVGLVLPRRRSCSLYLGIRSTHSRQCHSLGCCSPWQGRTYSENNTSDLEDGNTASPLAGYIAGMQRHDA
jgi:hypothetical protein